MIFVRTAYLILLFVVLGVLPGCNIPSNPEEREIVNFSIFETDTVKPIPVVDVPPATAGDRKQLDSVMDGFKKNAPKRFDDSELDQHIDRIESIFISSGRFLELIELYENEYNEKGLKAKMVERLVFAYINLGQKNTARKILDKLSKDRPESATLHFLEGNYWMRQERTLANLANSLQAFQKVLKLDPNFKGFEGMDAKAIRSIIDRLEPTIPKEMLEEIEAKNESKNKKEIEDKKNTEIKELENKKENVVSVENKEVKKPFINENPSLNEKPEPNEIPASKAVVEVKLDPNKSLEDSYLLNIAKAEIAVSEGRFAQADAFFTAAKKIKPDAFEANFGPLRARWRIETARNKIAVEIRKLSKTKLSAKQAYQLGLFVFSNMSTKKIARDLFESVKNQDPDYAKRVGIDALLNRL